MVPFRINSNVWLAALILDMRVFKEEDWVNDYPGEVYVCNSTPTFSIFSASELRILAAVKDVFQSYSAKKISDISHNEKGYQETENAQLISYRYAEQLSFNF